MPAFPLFLGLGCLIFSIATAALLFVVTGSLSVVSERTQFSLLLVSAVFGTIQCFFSAIVTYQCRHVGSEISASVRRRSRTSLLLMGVLPWLLSIALTATALGSLAAYESYNFFSRQIAIATLVIWIVSCLLYTLFFLILNLSPEFSSKALQETPKSEKPGSSTNTTSGSETPTTHSSNPFKDKQPSPAPASPLGPSVRSSFSTMNRPASSGKKNSMRSASQQRQSDRESSDGPSRGTSSRPSQEGGFDTWDTSEVSAQMKETVINSKHPKPVALPTIPGSRSPSPAKALEGPFFTPSPERSPPQSPLPQPPVSQPTSPISPQSPDFTSRFPPAPLSPMTTAPSSPPPTQSRRFSRPPSLIRRPSGEEHIHPLFRCSSPVPPPSASPTTTVTAAPEAGEVIDRRMLNRMRSTSMRSSSQPPAKSPLRRSDSFAHARSPRAPLSPPLPAMEPMSPARPKPLHQRKRSASFEGCIIRDEI